MQLEQFGMARVEEWKTSDDEAKSFLVLTAPDAGSDGPGWLRAYHRYGKVVMEIGQYLVVVAKPGTTKTVNDNDVSRESDFSRDTKNEGRVSAPATLQRPLQDR